MRTNIEVQCTATSEPEHMIKNGISVIVKSSIRREKVQSEPEPIEMWVYDEHILSNAEYGLILTLDDSSLKGQWDDGLQEMAREARYMKWDGAEQSARRKIELGIDVEQNQARLKKILDYKQAVHDTMNQPGYPTNEPIWPPEPIL